MLRDKRGRFIKKALLGTRVEDPISQNPFLITETDKEISFGGKIYRLNDGESWDDAINSMLANQDNIPGILSTKFTEVSNPTVQEQNVLDGVNTLTGAETETESGTLTGSESIERPWMSWKPTYTPAYRSNNRPSGGLNIFTDEDKKFDWKQLLQPPPSSDLYELIRAGIGANVNNRLTNRAIANETPFLQDVVETHRNVYGDYRARVEGERAAATLRAAASRPLTSDGALQQQAMLEAYLKGLLYVDLGLAKDEAMIRLTREVALQQEKENAQQRLAASMLNKKGQLMSQANRLNLSNQGDSVNFSGIISPVLLAREQRARNKEKKSDQYKLAYEDSLVKDYVWRNYSGYLTEELNILRNKFLNEGAQAVNVYIGNDPNKLQAWNSLRNVMAIETIKLLASLRGASINADFVLHIDDSLKYGIFDLPSSIDWGLGLFKKGGTVYKAKLTARTKDNDRAAKSIESSKKLAAKLIEKAIDSLYTYDSVELIAKPSKKRKYQTGGGLPYVNFSPVFATSEDGAPVEPAKETKKGEDLTTKDVLELLKEMDGLPTDIMAIELALANFDFTGEDELLGFSSSSIASLYISLINKIKIAQFNKNEYNSAFELLKGNGGLHEFAITSEGYLIGSNKDGDFLYFTPDLVNADEHVKAGYTLLTNSNLLYLRANSPTAAFNHKLTTVAQNGIGMEVITARINEIILDLATDKREESGIVQMGAKGLIIAGLEFLQEAANATNDAGITNNMSVADYYQAGYLTESLARAAQLALQYIWGALPDNAKALLQVKSGSSDGAVAFVLSLVSSKLDSSTKFTALPKKLTTGTSGRGGSGNSETDDLKLTPVLMMLLGYTEHKPIMLLKGTAYATLVNAQVLPITNVNKQLLGVTTLDLVAGSTFGGALDMNNATMGGQSIDPHSMLYVLVDATNLYVMNLPIDRNSPDGTIKPDLAWMTKIEEIDKVIRQKGITDVNEINKLYTEAGLPVLMNANGQLNTQDYCKFGVLNGHALDNAFRSKDALDNTVVEIEDENTINSILSIINKGRSEKDKVDFDLKSGWDSLFGTSHSSLYEGTVYIPIRTNPFTGMIGGGQYPTVEEAAMTEALVQQQERLKGYVDPGLLTD